MIVNERPRIGEGRCMAVSGDLECQEPIAFHVIWTERGYQSGLCRIHRFVMGARFGLLAAHPISYACYPSPSDEQRRGFLADENRCIFIHDDPDDDVVLQAYRVLHEAAS